MLFLIFGGRWFQCPIVRLMILHLFVKPLILGLMKCERPLSESVAVAASRLCFRPPSKSAAYPVMVAALYPSVLIAMAIIGRFIAPAAIPPGHGYVHPPGPPWGTLGRILDTYRNNYGDFPPNGFHSWVTSGGEMRAAALIHQVKHQANNDNKTYMCYVMIAKKSLS